MVKLLLLFLAASKVGGFSHEFHQLLLPRTETSSSIYRFSKVISTSIFTQSDDYGNNTSRRRISNALSVLSSKSDVNDVEHKSIIRKDSATESFNRKLVPMASAALLTTIDVFLRRYFKASNISFPSSLAGCGLIFTIMIGLYNIKDAWGDQLYNLLSPGSALLAKWLPVFFVPSLVTLPLAQSMGSAAEIAKVATVVVLGFLFTLLTTSWSVMGVRKILGSKQKLSQYPFLVPLTVSAEDKPNAVPNTPPFSSKTLQALFSVAAVSGFIATRTSLVLANPANSLFMLTATLASFVFGARFPPKLKKIVHPLVTCTGLTWLASILMAASTGNSFLGMLKLYKTGSLTPLWYTGAGDVLLFMLGPAVVALSCQMYDRKKLMRENLKEVGTAVVTSTVGGLFGTALMVRSFGIASASLRLSLLSRNITSPLAMAIATILNADVSLAVSIVVISGLIGANFGAFILDTANIEDPVARGLGIGAASHGLGTAAFSNEPDAFPFAAISMALTASLSTILVTIPAVRDLLTKIALGL